MLAREIDSLAYPWTASIWKYGGLTATPNVNLVENIGFGADATHTTGKLSKLSLPQKSIGAVSHPSDVAIDRSADTYVFSHHYKTSKYYWVISKCSQLYVYLRSILSKIYDSRI